MALVQFRPSSRHSPDVFTATTAKYRPLDFIFEYFVCILDVTRSAEALVQVGIVDLTIFLKGNLKKFIVFGINLNFKFK